MKLIKTFLLASLLGFVSHAHGQLNVNELARAIEASPDDAAALVEEAMAEVSTGQVNALVERLIKQFPNLAEEIVFGVLSGMPDASSDELLAVVGHAIETNRGLAPQIIVGARRATQDVEGLDQQITTVARNILRSGALGVTGQTSASPGTEIPFDDTLRISPSRASAN